ncbi:hypothetical protein CHUAL_011750 [Chamberlinius hualienensis]
MALNTAHANQGVLINAGEIILLYCDDVELHLDGDNSLFKGTKRGRIYLTTHRMIFTNKDKKDMFQSFSFPFMTISEVELEQPVFGANYIRGKVKAQPNGNWTGNAKFKLHFKSGGAIEYGQAMLQAAKTAARFMPHEPPPYTPPSGPYYQAPPPAYTPPPGGFYGFVPPTHIFAAAPPADMVYMTDQPPPYPGLNTGYNGYNNANFAGAVGGAVPSAPGWKPTSTADAKAQEAAQSAYYDPNNPHNTYMPPPPAYYQGPPSYDEATKKSQ